MRILNIWISCLLYISNHAQIAYKNLDINQVNATITNLGAIHEWGNYNVPKGSNTNSIFSSTLWMGGYDSANQLHLAADTYNQFSHEYWPGPLDTISATTNSATVQQYNKVWKISYTDLNDLIINFNNGNLQNGTYIPSSDILTWPAHGNGNYTRNLAPFIDNNNDGIYNPYQGDYPNIKGDQALYFIFNDNYNTHNHTQASPLGFEIHGMAYAYGGTCTNSTINHPELEFTTFFDYKIINRSPNTYQNFFIGLWVDVDLGCYTDDYIGCNISDNYGYVYNSSSYDSSCGSIGYNNYPPTQGVIALKGPESTNNGIDDDFDGTIDEINEQQLMSNFMTYYNNIGNFNPLMTEPINQFEFYNYLNAKWKDGTPLTCGNNGYNGSIQTTHIFPGDPNSSTSNDPYNICGNWVDFSNSSLDRRFILTAGPTTILPNQSFEVEYALVTSFDSTSNNPNLASVSKLKTDIVNLKSFLSAPTIPNCLQLSISTGVDKLKQKNLTLYPNPVKKILNIELHNIDNTELSIFITDITGQQVLATSYNSKLDLSMLEHGIYFIFIYNKNRLIGSHKIVKE